MAMVEMARPVIQDSFGVSLDNDPCAWMFLLREYEHFAECGGCGCTVFDRRIALRLVNDQNIAWFRPIK
jgi:hypothetical protein